MPCRVLNQVSWIANGAAAAAVKRTNIFVSLGIAIATGHIIIFAIKTSPLVSISPCNEDKVSAVRRARRAYLSGRVDLTRRCSTKWTDTVHVLISRVRSCHPLCISSYPAAFNAPSRFGSLVVRENEENHVLKFMSPERQINARAKLNYDKMYWLYRLRVCARASVFW